MKLFPCLVLFFFLTLPGAKAGEIFDVNGDRLGMSLGAFMEKYDKSFMGIGRSPACVSAGADEFYLSDQDAMIGVVSCSQFKVLGRPDKLRTTFEGLAANVHYQFFHGRLFKILATIESDQFEKMIGRLSAKIGPPKGSRTETYMVRLGVPFTNRIVEWQDPLSSMAATKFAASISQSIIVVQEDDLHAEYVAALGALKNLQASSSR